MARVTCRCGETLDVPPTDPERLTCLRCGAKIRVRRSPEKQRTTAPSADGFVRFYCPCGRRLKVRIEEQSKSGKCPDCGRIVPVPQSARLPAGKTSKQVHGQSGRPPSGTRTEDMDAADFEHLDQWSRRHQPKASLSEKLEPGHAPGAQMEARHFHHVDSVPLKVPETVKVEAGLRVCTRCRKPLHLSATVCRFCGELAPRSSSGS